MPIEIEKKYRLNSDTYAATESRLGEIGAEFRGTYFETNILFQNDFLRLQGAFVRLRKVDEKTILTYKKKLSVESGLKTQLEFETVIADFDAAVAIIGELGLSETLVYQKRRSTWHIDNAEIVLDELPFGLYMEIEGDAGAIAFAEARLGVGSLEVEDETYPMLTRHFGETSEGIARAMFDENAPLISG